MMGCKNNKSAPEQPTLRSVHNIAKIQSKPLTPQQKERVAVKKALDYQIEKHTRVKKFKYVDQEFIFALTFITRPLIDSAIRYRSKLESWSKLKEKSAQSELVSRILSNESTFIFTVKTSPNGSVKLPISLKEKRFSIQTKTSKTYHLSNFSPIFKNEVHGTKKDGNGSAVGYLYFNKINLQSTNSILITVQGIMITAPKTYLGLKGGSKEVELSFQFDTTPVDFLTMLKKSIPDAEIRKSGSLPMIDENVLLLIKHPVSIGLFSLIKIGKAIYQKK